MSELDLNILKRNLPEDIHVAVDQVRTNIDSAVKQIVDGFKKNANDVADRFEKMQFDSDLEGKLNAIRKGITDDLDKLDAEAADLKNLAELVQKTAAASATAAPALATQVQTLVEKSVALTKKLGDFRTKTTTFAEKTGGLIAKSAIRAVTGGVAG